MRSESDFAIANFRESAVRTFLFFWMDFQKNVSAIDRHKDENVFLQLKNRYSDSLKTSLHGTVEKILNQYGGNKTNLRFSLTEQVALSITAFNGKVNAL